MDYKKSTNPDSASIIDQQSEDSSAVEELLPQCVSFFLELFQQSKTNFENENLDALKQNFIDIVKLIEKGGLLCIREEILIQYTIDLIGILDQLLSNPDEQITVFYGLRIIHHFFYIRTSIMNFIILNGYLLFFQNLIHSSEKHIKEVSTYIAVLFFLSPEIMPIALSSSFFSDFCDIYASYLEDPKNNYPILSVVSNAFNSITKLLKDDENVTIEMIEKIMELYSLSIKDNVETKLISCFIEFIQILKSKIDNSIISLLFNYNVPYHFYQILFTSQTYKNSALYFFAFLTAYINPDEYQLMKEFFNFEAFLNLFTESQPSLFKQNYAFLIIENSLKFDIDLLNMVVTDQFLAFIVRCFNTSEFLIKYHAGCCLFSALNAASFVSIEIVQKLFSSEIMLIGLDIFEIDDPNLIDKCLNTLEFTISRLLEVFTEEKTVFFDAFKEKFFETLQELQNSDNEDIKMHAHRIQKRFFEDDYEELAFDPETHMIDKIEKEDQKE